VKIKYILLLAIFFCFPTRLLQAQPPEPSSIVIFQQEGFPSAESAAPNFALWHAFFPGAHYAGAGELAGQLASEKTRLLVLPYGSAFPEAQWPAILGYLERGGNLLVLGGRPFSQAAWQDANGWHLRPYSVRFLHQLFIDQYEPAPGSKGLTYASNSDVPDKVGTHPLRIGEFAWSAAYSPVIRLSQADRSPRGGSAGEIDSLLKPLAWGEKDGRRLAVPVYAVDHLQRRFAGGRWVFASAGLDERFYTQNGRDHLQVLAYYAAMGAMDFTLQLEYPLYAAGERPRFTVHGPKLEGLSLWLKVEDPAAGASQKPVAQIYADGMSGALPEAASKGLIHVRAELHNGLYLLASYNTAYWVRDEAYLRGGPRLGVNRDTFTLDGAPMIVAGTTYMASDVQRLYFERPNVDVWERDLAQIRGAGMNMIRSGWWSGWESLADAEGRPNEHTLRTVEAFLMSARHNNLPVQFNFFAFLPEVLGGENPYLDPVAVTRQKNLIGGVVGRFHDVPWLAWDLINEPSIAKTMWRMRSNGDAIERKAWRAWLDQHDPDKAALAAAWNVTDVSDPAPPAAGEYDPRSMYSGPNSLKVHDFYLFAEKNFSDWAQQMRATIRGTGSQQLVVIGQDEGGGTDRLPPAYFADAVDFTTNHTWWQDDQLLWDSLTAKQLGKPMLIQETGVQRMLAMDETARRSTENLGALFERKLALSMVGGTGAIEWLWNSNGYMTEANETPIGALREDGSEREEAGVLRGFAKFAQEASPWLVEPKTPEVVVLASEAAQLSANNLLQIEAQQKAVRALAYYNRISPRLVAGNHAEQLAGAKLVILPAPQAIGESEWQKALDYGKTGGTLLVTGSIERDEHWQATHRAEALKLAAFPEPVTYRGAAVEVFGHRIAVDFDQEKQGSVEAVRFAGGKTFEDRKLPVNNGGRNLGHLYWAAEPLELGEGAAAAAGLYAQILKAAGIEPAFELKKPLSSSVLVHATPMKAAVLYVFSNESAEAAEIDLRDKASGAAVSLKLAAGHAALAVLETKSGKLVARYGF
jgi:hypothetical protein